MNEGKLNILNVGAGDLELSFSKDNPAERIRAARVVRDMLRRGYALLVEVERDGEKRFERAVDFDEQHCRYIIADFDPITAQEQDRKQDREKTPDGESEKSEAGGQDVTPDTTKRRGRGRPSRSVEADGTRAVAVARSAGG